jgi:hypothetical protein
MQQSTKSKFQYGVGPSARTVVDVGCLYTTLSYLQQKVLKEATQMATHRFVDKRGTTMFCYFCNLSNKPIRLSTLHQAHCVGSEQQPYEEQDHNFMF